MQRLSLESSIQIEEAAAVWLAKRDGGDWTDADQAELTRWLHASTANRVAFIRLNAAWQQANRLKALGAGVRPGVVPPPAEWGHSLFSDMRQAAPESGVAGLSPSIATPDSDAVQRGALASADERESTASATYGGALRGQRRLAHPYRALAASVLLAVALGAGWYLWPAGPSYRTAVGGLAAVPMSDGSRITLNTNSEIRVAVSKTERRVELEHGEAFFEVASDPARPFVVEAGDKRVIAIGTKFSVRREEGRRGEVVVVVTEGRVRVESAATGLVRTMVPPAEVSAGSIARSADAAVLIQEKPLPETEEILSWRSGYLIFRDTALSDAVAEFNRYNTNQIVIEDAAVAGIRIGGNFRSTNVEAFVRLLEDGFPIRVDRHSDRIVLTER